MVYIKSPIYHYSNIISKNHFNKDLRGLEIRNNFLNLSFIPMLSLYGLCNFNSRSYDLLILSMFPDSLIIAAAILQFWPMR